MLLDISEPLIPSCFLPLYDSQVMRVYLDFVRCLDVLLTVLELVSYQTMKQIGEFALVWLILNN